MAHREQVNKEMAGARNRLGGNGTALYSTGVAGMMKMDHSTTRGPATRR